MINKYNELKQLFINNRDDECAISMSNYMKNNFLFYGINSKKRKELERQFIKSEKLSKKIDWIFLKECYNDDYREMQYFVLDCLSSQSKLLTYNDIEELEYFVKNKEWWDSIDILDKIIGNINDSRIDDLMFLWSKSDNIWYRRLSIDHQQTKKLNTNTELLEKIIVNNLNSDEFFINKAIGWSLREYSKYNKNWVINFINKYKDKLNKLSIKEASKYL